jgi:hypothetical protein
VLKLELGGAGLKGSWSGWELLGSLTALRTLDLGDNAELSGQAPASLLLPELRFLSVANTCVEGTLPPSLVASEGLTELLFESSRIEGTIPDSYCKLTNLRKLQGYRTSLSGSLPHCLGNMTSLEQLWLKETDISGSIPEV